MEAVFLKLLEQLNSSVFILLGILVVAAYTLHSLGRWRERFFNQDKRLDKIESMHDKVVILETKIQLIYENTNPKRAFMSSSPIRLTDFGHDLFGKIGGEKMFPKYIAKLQESVENENPNHPYDIQMIAMNVAKSVLPKIASADDVNAVKQQAFENGILDEDIWGIFGVLLRDKILEERGMPISDVDKHDPNKRQK